MKTQTEKKRFVQYSSFKMQEKTVYLFIYYLLSNILKVIK